VKGKAQNSAVLALAVLMLSVFLSGCVTTTDSRFSREADRDKAVANYVQLATAYIGQGNLDRARQHLDRALELAPDSPSALAAKGLVFSAENEPELAERSFKRAISEDAGYTRGRVYYGAFLFSDNRFSDARDQFAAASRDTGYRDRGAVFYNLGMTEERLGDLKAAEAAYRRAVELTRGEARTLLSLSRVLVEQSDYSAASRYFSRLQAMIQGSPRLSHSAESLYTGILIARYFSDKDQEVSFGLLLRNNYPDSAEYQQYKAMSANER